MDLKKILSVSGKSGLFKVIAQTKNGAIVESMTDKKRFPVFATDKISTLADISVFCGEEDMPLKDVFKKISEKENAQKVTLPANGDALKIYFNEVLPEYDKERVYVSDIKKIVTWYNQLIENKLLEFTDESENQEVKAEEPEKTEQNTENAKE